MEAIVKEIFKRLIKKVQDNPDFVYHPLNTSQGCSYTSGANCNGCIFGQILQEMGIETDVLNSYEGITIFSLLLQLYEIEDGVDNYMKFFNRFQAKQDTGNSWFKCLEQTIINNQ